MKKLLILIVAVLSFIMAILVMITSNLQELTDKHILWERLMGGSLFLSLVYTFLRLNDIPRSGWLIAVIFTLLFAIGFLVCLTDSKNHLMINHYQAFAVSLTCLQLMSWAVHTFPKGILETRVDPYY